MLKKVLGACTALALALGGLAIAGPASATTPTTECVPQAAYTETITPASPGKDAVYETVTVSEAGWQRYSYTGAYKEAGAPPFPGDNWQPNVKDNPHKVPKAGAYFIDKGDKGLGDWFYLEAIEKVTKEVLVSPAVTATPAETVDHKAIVCVVPVDPTPPVVVEPPVGTPPVVVPPVDTPPAVIVPPVVGTPPVEAPPVVTTQCVVTPSIVVTPGKLQGFSFSPVGSPYADTRTAGHYEFVDGALRVYTDNATSQAKIQGMRAIAIKASEYGTGADLAFDFASGTVEPGINIRVDVTGDGKSDATLTSEDIYTETYWTNAAGVLPVSTGGQGGAFAGDINDLLALHPNAVVVAEGFSLGSGVLADGKITSITTGCTTILFNKDVVVVEPEPDPEPPVITHPVLPVTPVAPVIPETPKTDAPAAAVVAPQVDVLAYTGLSAPTIWIGVAILAILVGVGAFVANRILNRRKSA